MRSRPGSPRAASANGASGDTAATASRNSAESATLRASGPRTLSPCQWSGSGASDTRPREGLSPKSPQQAAGMRIDPPPSEPSATGASPAATAAAEPPLEPPQVRSARHGLRVIPQLADSVKGQIASSGMWVLPRSTAPAPRSRLTTSESALAGARGERVPKQDTSPATSTLSFTATGTPSSGRSSPARRRASACSASASARSE